MARTLEPTGKKPEPKVLHKRRSEDEMRRALADYVSGKPMQRDDFREAILADAITEVIELRRILMDVTARLDALHADTMAGIRSILSPQ